MPVLQKGVAAVANKMPKVISPKAHAIIDYVTVASFWSLAGLFWSRDNKRAAIAAIICGGSEFVTALLTDMPGGVWDTIDLPTHIKIDFGLAATATSLPNLMGFDDEPEAKWFRILGLNITANAAMTNTGEQSVRQRRRRVA